MKIENKGMVFVFFLSFFISGKKNVIFSISEKSKTANLFRAIKPAQPATGPVYVIWAAVE